MDEWIIYIVANTVTPYAYELPLILAYPLGFSYRARFKKEWIEESLLSLPENLSNTRCLIVYRHFETGALFPIRFGKIKKIEIIGEVVYIEYTLEAIVPYHDVSEKRRQQLTDFQQEWQKQHPEVAKTNVPEGHMKPLVLRSKFIPTISNPYLAGTESDNEFASWSNTCDLLTDIPMYADTEFLKVVDLMEDFSDREVQMHKSRYVLSPGRCYRLRVAQRVFRATGNVIPHNLVLTCAGKGIEGTTQHQMAVGKYDILTFRLHSSSARQKMAGVATISGTEIKEIPLQLELICEVRPKIPVKGLLLVFIGCLTLLFPEYIIHLTKLGASLTNIIQRIGTILFVIGIMDSRALLEYISSD